jgi:hypothetical protein
VATCACRERCLFKPPSHRRRCSLHLIAAAAASISSPPLQPPSHRRRCNLVSFTCRAARATMTILAEGKVIASLHSVLFHVAQSDMSLPEKYVNMPLLLRLSPFATRFTSPHPDYS